MTTIARLYLGRNRNGVPTIQREVTDTEMEGFLDAFVTPIYPNGYTRYDAMGNWWLKGANSPETERTTILEIANPDTFPGGEERIARAWKAYAEQEAVMVTKTVADMAFV